MLLLTGIHSLERLVYNRKMLTKQNYCKIFVPGVLQHALASDFSVLFLHELLLASKTLGKMLICSEMLLL